MIADTPQKERFLQWVAPRDGKPTRYDLYRQIFKNLPRADTFWSRIEEAANKIQEHKRGMLPHLFMGAVQYLALSHPKELLATFFPASASYDPARPRPSAGSIFQEFCARRWRELLDIVRSKDVQINKVGRLSLFAPLFLEVQRRCSRPLAFVDVGASIGFGMLWESFTFNYGERGRIAGPSGGTNELCCRVEGRGELSFNGILPAPVFLCGIDKHPLNPNSDSDVRWLLALTAPDDAAGRSKLGLGLNLAARMKPRIEKGCALDVLPRIEEKCPREWALVTYHAMTMHHFEPVQLKNWHAMLATLAAQRPVFEIGVEWLSPWDMSKGTRPVEITVRDFTFSDGRAERFGETDPSADGTLFKLNGLP